MVAPTHHPGFQVVRRLFVSSRASLPVSKEPFSSVSIAQRLRPARPIPHGEGSSGPLAGVRGTPADRRILCSGRDRHSADWPAGRFQGHLVKVEYEIEVSMRTRRQFSGQSKVEAVNLVKERGVPVRQTARDPDVQNGVLRKCLSEPVADLQQAVPGSARRGCATPVATPSTRQSVLLPM